SGTAEAAWTKAKDAARPVAWAPAKETATAHAAAATVALWAPAHWGAGEAARWVRQCGRVDRESESRAQAALIRCIFNPYRKSQENSLWLTPDAVAIANAIYAEGASASAPILADALEEAGCSDESILSHLRSPGPHVRGCWALDLILSRN